MEGKCEIQSLRVMHVTLKAAICSGVVCWSLR